MTGLLTLLAFLQGQTLDKSALARSDNGYTYYQRLTGDDSDSDKSRWNTLYGKKRGYLYGKEPAAFLVENLSLLPVGLALDLAMGEGRNSVYLAKKGFDVTGVDISEVAVRKARRLAKENNTRFKAVVADLTNYKIPPESFDVIIVFYYVQRSLTPQIVRGLKKGGILVFEAYNKDQVKYDKAENADFLLERGELKTMFKGLETVKYRQVDSGSEVYESLIARKPK